MTCTGKPPEDSTRSARAPSWNQAKQRLRVHLQSLRWQVDRLDKLIDEEPLPVEALEMESDSSATDCDDVCDPAEGAQAFADQAQSAADSATMLAQSAQSIADLLWPACWDCRTP